MLNIKLLNEAYRDQRDAVNLITMLLDVFAFFDTVDKEIHVSPANAETVLWYLLVDIPGNPFFRGIADRIAPLLQQALVALPVHRSRETHIPVERRALTDLAIHLSLLIAGPQHARLYAPLLTEMLHTNPVEPLDALD